MKMIPIAGALLSFGLATTAGAADMDGHWARSDGKAKVNVSACGADVCAINTWIKPGTSSEKSGDKLVMTIKPVSSGEYSGTAFDPQRDMTYKITVSVHGDKMTTRGCVLAGIICKGVDWTRIR